MGQEIITADGEVIEDGDHIQPPALVDTATLSALVKAEIDTAITTARSFPRSVKRAIDNIVTLATLDEATAVECIYALKRGGKTLRGPSIRLAEIIGQQWGNNRSEARVVQIDRVNKMVVAEGMFHDLETNMLTKATVQRRISDRNGRIYNDDMIAVTGNAACSIAKRNAILAGVPKGIWRRGQEAAEHVIRGDAKTLGERRDVAVKAFAHFGMSAEQVFQVMDVKGIEDIGLDDLVTLRGMYASLKNGEQTVDEIMRGARGATASDHKRIANPLADEDPEARKETGDGGTETAKTDGAGKAATKDAGDGKAASAKKTKAEPSPLDVARQRGAEAKRKGHLRKALPGEYRDEARKDEADAWYAAYDAAEAADDGAM